MNKINKTKQYAVVECWGYEINTLMELLGTTTSWEEALGYVFKRIAEEEYEYLHEAIYNNWNAHPNNIPKGWQEDIQNKRLSIDQAVTNYLDDDKTYSGVYHKSFQYSQDFHTNNEDDSFRFLRRLRYKFEDPRTIDIRILVKEVEEK